jgi:hypothetical protein
VDEHRVQGQPPDVEAGAIYYRKKIFLFVENVKYFF